MQQAKLLVRNAIFYRIPLQKLFEFLDLFIDWISTQWFCYIPKQAYYGITNTAQK